LATNQIFLVADLQNVIAKIPEIYKKQEHRKRSNIRPFITL
jgi:hypothetical protein